MYKQLIQLLNVLTCMLKDFFNQIFFQTLKSSLKLKQPLTVPTLIANTWIPMCAHHLKVKSVGKQVATPAR